jgi:hypothetical protein
MSDVLELAGRHEIVDGTRFAGGYLLGRGAIVVDYVENPEPYNSAYEDFKYLALSNYPEVNILGIAAAVDRVAKTLHPMSGKKVTYINADEAAKRGILRIDHSQAIGLSKFIGHAGTCQHQTLLGARLLEMLEDEYALGGEINIRQHFEEKTEEHRHVDLSYRLGEDLAYIKHTKVKVFKP